MRREPINFLVEVWLGLEQKFLEGEACEADRVVEHELALRFRRGVGDHLALRDVAAARPSLYSSVPTHESQSVVLVDCITSCPPTVDS